MTDLALNAHRCRHDRRTFKGQRFDLIVIGGNIYLVMIGKPMCRELVEF
jgi:hypothetical protein